MNKFEYTPASKFYCRYSIAPLSLILITSLVVQISAVRAHPLMLFLVAINGALLFLANKQFYKSYSELPFLIVAGKEKLTASNFMFGKKTVEIKYSDIDIVSGGVFGYSRKGVIFLHDGEQNTSIAIHPSIVNVDELVKIIVNNVNAELRDEMITKLRRREK
jgi:hypothetical protein